MNSIIKLCNQKIIKARMGQKLRKTIKNNGCPNKKTILKMLNNKKKIKLAVAKLAVVEVGKYNYANSKSTHKSIKTSIFLK